MTRQLLALSRQQILQPRVINLTLIVDGDRLHDAMRRVHAEVFAAPLLQQFKISGRHIGIGLGALLFATDWLDPFYASGTTASATCRLPPAPPAFESSVSGPASSPAALRGPPSHWFSGSSASGLRSSPRASAGAT